MNSMKNCTPVGRLSPDEFALLRANAPLARHNAIPLKGIDKFVCLDGSIPRKNQVGYS